MSEQIIDKGTRKSPWTKIIISIIVLAIIAGGFVFYLARSAQKHVENFLKENGVSFSSLDVSWRRHFTIHDAKINFSKDRSLRAETIKGEVNFSGKTSKKLELEKISYALGQSELSIPVMTLENFALNDAKTSDNQYFFDIRNITAKKIVAPTVIWTDGQKTAGTTFSYNNVIFDDIAKGLIKKVTADSMSGEYPLRKKSASPADTEFTKMECGKSELNNLDLGFLVSYFNESTSGSNAENPFKDVANGWSIHDIVINLPLKGENSYLSTTQTMWGTKLSLRHLPFSLNSLIEESANYASPDNAGKTKEHETLLKELAILSSVGFADLHVDGVSRKFADLMTTKLKNFSVTYRNGHVDISLDGYEAAGKYLGSLIIDNFSITNLRSKQLNDFIDVLNREISSGKADYESLYNLYSNPDLMIVMPQFKNIHTSGVKFSDSTTENSEGYHFTLGAADVNTDFGEGIIPTSLKIVIKDFEVAAERDRSNIMNSILSPYSDPQKEPDVLKEIGYKTIKYNGTFDASWDRDSQKINFNNTFDYKDMATASFNGTLSNVRPELFSDNLAMIIASALVIHINDLHLTANADSFLERYAKFYDANTGEKFADKRKEAAIKARLAIAIFLGAENSQKSGEAVQNFLESGGTINIDAVAKSKDGLGLDDLLALRLAPTTFVDKIDLSADTTH
ncbi:hypothetical protein [uncultured Bartonella sp.]|uniref:hypothetical protein n=1 Tax=uncultured Bartonella sp. TaxID=104108 RepID=UPI0025E31BD5|nr:hypothetical protein [uncultured Bartonella sp.]